MIETATLAQAAEGLTAVEAGSRLTHHGPNVVERERTASPLALLFRQFKNPVVWLLIVAAVVAAALGEVIDAIAIGAIVIINALVGFFQEYRAERAVLALRAMTAPRARVLRDGHAVVIAAARDTHRPLRR